MTDLVYPIAANSIVSQVTLKIKITGRQAFRARVAVGCWLIRLAARVIGTNLVIGLGEFDAWNKDYAGQRRAYALIGGIEVPLAASIKQDSPLYVPDHHVWGPKVDFYLDGELQNDVVSYDVDEGAMRVHRRRPDGQLYICGDEVATEVLHGRIEIRPRD